MVVSVILLRFVGDLEHSATLCSGSPQYMQRSLFRLYFFCLPVREVCFRVIRPSISEKSVGVNCLKFKSQEKQECESI